VHNGNSNTENNQILASMHFPAYNNADILEKLIKFWPQITLLLRILEIWYSRSLINDYFSRWISKYSSPSYTHWVIGSYLLIDEYRVLYRETTSARFLIGVTPPPYLIKAAILCPSMESCHMFPFYSWYIHIPKIGMHRYFCVLRNIF